MPMFSRLAIKPSAELLYKLTVRTFASWIPTGYRWFERDALDANKELGREIRAWSKIGADLRTAIETLRWEVFLQTTDRAQLDAFRLMLKMREKTGETDDALARRIAAELVAKRLTKEALEAIVPLLSEGKVGAVLHEPWKNVIIWGEAWWGRYFNDERYHRGAVIELQTNDTQPEDTEEIMDRVKGGGVLDWYARIISTEIVQDDDPLAALVAGEIQSFVTADSFHTIESVGCGTDVILVTTALPNELSIVGPDMGNVLTWGMGLTFQNILTNYALATDMLASAQAGSAQHYVKVTTPFDVEKPTDLQPGAIAWSQFYLDDGTQLGDPGALLSPP